VLSPGANRISTTLITALCIVIAILALRWATDWQNELRSLMQMPAIDSAGPWTTAGLALLSFACLLGLGRLPSWLIRKLSGKLSPILSRPSALFLAAAITASLFWSIGNGLLAHIAMRWADKIYSNLDALIEDDTAPPTAWDKAGARDSLINWHQMGRKG